MRHGNGNPHWTHYLYWIVAIQKYTTNVKGKAMTATLQSFLPISNKFRSLFATQKNYPRDPITFWEW